MPDFAYIARDVQGKRVTGTVAAATAREAVSLLSGQALFPVEVTADQPIPAWRRGRRISGQQMAVIYAQLSGLLRSGVPLLRSLQVLQNQTSNSSLQQTLEDVHDRVEDGATLAEAMRHHPRAFGELAVSMVRAGGEGGFLEDALERIAQFTEQQEDLKSRTLGALAYPIFLAVVGTLGRVRPADLLRAELRTDFRRSARGGAVAGDDERSDVDERLAAAVRIVSSARPGTAGDLPAFPVGDRARAVVGPITTGCAFRCWDRSTAIWPSPASAACWGRCCTTACRSSSRWKSAATPPETESCPKPSKKPRKTSRPVNLWRGRWPPPGIFPAPWWK